MLVVALVTLGRSVDAETPELAAALGVTPYEAGQLLRGGTPSLVLRTTDRGRALGLLSQLRERGHDAVAFDDAAVVSSEEMFQIRSFALEPDALVCACPGRPEERVAFADLTALVRAVHQTRSEATSTTRERSVSLGRIALSGGLLPTKTITKETKQTSDTREPVLYLFRRTKAPVLLGATRARYGGLGADVRPAQHQNFERLIAILRSLAPGAQYDTRLLSLRAGAQEKLSSGRRGEHSASSASGVDVLAHTVALVLSRSPDEPRPAPAGSSFRR